MVLHMTLYMVVSMIVGVKNGYSIHMVSVLYASKTRMFLFIKMLL